MATNTLIRRVNSLSHRLTLRGDGTVAALCCSSDAKTTSGGGIGIFMMSAPGGHIFPSSKRYEIEEQVALVAVDGAMH